MSADLAFENQGVLQTLKQSTNKKVILQELLSVILNRQISRKQAKLFLNDKYSKQKVQWLQMSDDQIYSMALAAKKYKLDNQQKWKQQQLALQRQIQQKQLLRKEQQTLRLEMIRKNITRQAMIKLVQQSIEKCQQIMITCQDQLQYARLKKSTEDLTRELFILQGKYFQDMDVKEIPEPDDEIDPEIYSRIKAIKQKKLQEIERAKQMRIKEQKIKEEALKKKLAKVRSLVQVIFNHYARESAVGSQTFAERQKVSETIDLTIFLKFVRDFEIVNKHSNIYSLSKLFKKLAINGLWITVDQFYDLLVGMYKIQKIDANGKPLPFKDNEFVDYMNSYITNQQKMKDLLHFVEIKSPHRYEFYTHSGLLKQDVKDEINRRRMLNQQKKCSTKDIKRKSVSFPSLHHHPRSTKSTDLRQMMASRSPKLRLSKLLSSKEKQLIGQQPTLRKSIYEQLKQLEDKKTQRQVKKLIDLKAQGQDEFLNKLQAHKKSSIM